MGSGPLFDQVGITAEMLRQMIIGDHPVDLCLMRLCACKLCPDAVSQSTRQERDHLIDEVEVLDLALMFEAPDSLLRNLRGEALQTLDRLQTSVKAMLPA